MAALEVFKELLKLRGVDESQSIGSFRLFTCCAKYFAYQPYRWDKTQNQLKVASRSGIEQVPTAPAKLAAWMFVYATAILITLCPVKLIRQEDLERKIIHMFIAGLIASVMFLVNFHERTCSEFCQFVNSTIKYLDNSSKVFSSGGKCKI